MRRQKVEDYPHRVVLNAGQSMNLHSAVVGWQHSYYGTSEYIPIEDYACNAEIVSWLRQNVPRGGYRRRKIRLAPDFQPALEVRFKEAQHAVLFKLRWYQ